MDRFDDIVAKAWDRKVEGNYQFQLCQKHRILGVELKNFTKDIFW